MQDIIDVIKNIELLFNNNQNYAILKDFERVLDEINLYVYDNWIDGELVSGPIVERYWVTCKFMWPKNQMPDPSGAERLLGYGCKIKYIKTHLIVPRKIKSPDDYRPGTRKGKLDQKPIWVVEIMMPKKLILDIFRNYREDLLDTLEPANDNPAPELTTSSEETDFNTTQGMM